MQKVDTENYSSQMFFFISWPVNIQPLSPDSKTIIIIIGHAIMVIHKKHIFHWHIFEFTYFTTKV